MGRVFNALNKAENASDHPDLIMHPRAEISAERPYEPPLEIDPSRFRPSVKRPAASTKWHERLVTALGNASTTAEEFRRLRTSLLHPPAGKTMARTILVTSAMPGEGKTFICAGLAITLAQGLREHALMIDCDLRRPFLGEMFGITNQRGLSDYLNGKAELGRLIVNAGLAKLSLLPSGPPPVNPAELLGSEKFQAMVKEVSDRYQDRFIIFDSPPQLKAAETAILARHVDGVVLVVREGVSSRENLHQLVESIDPEKIVGVVFNAHRPNLLERKIYGGSYHNYSSY